MPDIKVYIRQEDLERWNLIPKKSLFIHEALNSKSHSFHPNMKMPKTLEEANDPKSMGYSARIVPDIFVPTPPDPKTGYPCCTKRYPCKHWRFNDIDSVWENELTGQTKEI